MATYATLSCCQPREWSGGVRITTHVLRVTLAHIRPPIWRRLAVPSDTSLATLHDALQVAFGWEDCHLHEFRVGDARYGVPDPDDEELRDEAEVTLAEVLPRKSAHLEYVYDLGDYWVHAISVERVEEAAPSGTRTMRPRRRAGTIECLAGERAAPPEDCGGPPGYAELLEALADTSHPEHADMREGPAQTSLPSASCSPTSIADSRGSRDVI